MFHTRPCMCMRQESINKAVHRCCQARNRVLADCKGLNMDLYDSTTLSTEAYLAALPQLSTAQDVKDYIACINHAAALNLLKPYEASSFLASARLSLNVIRGEENFLLANEKLEQGKEKVALSKAREERQQARQRLKEQPRTAA